LPGGEIVEKKFLQIQGMSCNHCVARVNKTLAMLPGVIVEDVKVGSARIQYDPEKTSLAQIGGALDEAGYPVAEGAGA
jgi:copper chaperone